MIFQVDITLKAGQLRACDSGDFKFFRLESMPSSSATVEAVLDLKGKKSTPFPLVVGKRIESEILYQNLFLTADTDGVYVLTFSDNEKIIDESVGGAGVSGFIVNSDGTTVLNVPDHTVPPALEVGHVDVISPLPVTLAPGTSIQLDVRNMATLRLALGRNVAAGELITVTDQDKNFGHQMPLYPVTGGAVQMGTLNPGDGVNAFYVPLVGVGSVNIRFDGPGPANMQLTYGLSSVPYVPRLG